MSKTFTIVGTSNLNGKVKNRFANGTVKHRTQVLERNGHTEIRLVELPSPMSKADAVAFLEAQAIMAPTVTAESVTLGAEVEPALV